MRNDKLIIVMSPLTPPPSPRGAQSCRALAESPPSSEGRAGSIWV